MTLPTNCKESAQCSVPRIPGSETKDTIFVNLRQLHHQAAASGASHTPACGNHSTCMRSLTIQADLEGLLCNSSLLCGQPPRPPSHSFPLLARSSGHFPLPSICHNPTRHNPKHISWLLTHVTLPPGLADTAIGVFTLLSCQVPPVQAKQNSLVK